MGMGNMYEGKTAVITGAASGLGLAIARAAAHRGLSLVLADNRAEPLSSAAAALRDAGLPVLEVVLDVASPDAVALLAARTRERFGTPHLLVNNAGVFSGGLIWEQSAAEWDRVLRVNLLGVVQGVNAFTPAMLAAAEADPTYHGWIVNTSSVAGLIGMPLGAAYSVMKHAVVAFSEILNHDLAKASERVRCAVLCPHFVETELVNRNPGSPPETRSQKLARKFVGEAMIRGRLDADGVAEILFAGLEAGQFYIHTHPERLSGLETRRSDLERDGEITPFPGEIDFGPLLRRRASGIAE